MERLPDHIYMLTKSDGNKENHIHIMELYLVPPDKHLHATVVLLKNSPSKQKKSWEQIDV